MSTFLTVGLSHHRVPLEYLEYVALTAPGRGDLQDGALVEGCAETFVLSTCGRTELYAVLDSAPSGGGAERAAAWAAADRLAGMLVAPAVRAGRDLSDSVSVAVGDAAVRHLFRVAAGLDSRVVGEVEVQAQLRAAARQATAAEGEPHRLRRVVAAALAHARRIGSDEPGLPRRGILARRAVRGAMDSVDDCGRMDAVVVGSGAMGRQVVEALAPVQCGTTLLSRSSRAREGMGGGVEPLEKLPMRLVTADMVFVATAAGSSILSRALVQEALKNRPERPLVIVDLALPRNVDADVVGVPGVVLLDLDDLADNGVSGAPDGLDVAAAEAEARAAADEYCADIRSRRAGPMIGALRARVEDVCLDQLRRTSRGFELPDEAIARMASAVAGAVAHRPTVLARRAAAQGDAEALEMLATVFELEDLARRS